MTALPSTTPDSSMNGTTPAGSRSYSYTYWDSPGPTTTSDVLSSTGCWALATTQSTGRLGFLRDGLLDIFPVNYLVMAEHLYFRTSTDGTIATSCPEHAAFQIDHIHRKARSGWTVLLNGSISRVDDPSLLTTLWGRTLDEPWAQGQAASFFDLSPTLVRGRRIESSQ